MFNIISHLGNADQNHSRMASHKLLVWLKLERLAITSVSKDVEKLECSHLTDGTVKWCSRSGTSLAVSQKATHRVVIRPGNCASRYTREKWKHTSTRKLVCEVFTVMKRWKQTKRPSTDEQVDWIRFIHTMDHYLATEKNEVLTHTTMWVNSETMFR